jgi:hypothetical protein
MIGQIIEFIATTLLLFLAGQIGLAEPLKRHLQAHGAQGLGTVAELLDLLTRKARDIIAFGGGLIDPVDQTKTEAEQSDDREAGKDRDGYGDRRQRRQQDFQPLTNRFLGFVNLAGLANFQ